MKDPRILILGGEGMLGHKAFQVLGKRFSVFATVQSKNGLWKSYPTYHGIPPGQVIQGVDATDISTVEGAIGGVKPDVVINCIGIVKQVQEAKDPLISIAVNSLFPHQLASLCENVGARLVHMSTDCVFSGKKGDYREEDNPDATDLYGRTKLLGEVLRDGCLSIRTSIIGRDFAKKTGLLEWFLSNQGGHVQGYVNAIFSGFTTQWLAHIIGDIIADYPNLSGLYHISSEPISKYDLLVMIRDALKLNIVIERFEGYRCDRSLDSSRFQLETGYALPKWQEMITELAADDTPYDDWRELHADV